MTVADWAFTLTDGALRMLVLLHFNALGYTPVQLAFLFLFYEVFGIVANLLGGVLAARLGLKVTLTFGARIRPPEGVAVAHGNRTHRGRLSSPATGFEDQAGHQIRTRYRARL